MLSCHKTSVVQFIATRRYSFNIKMSFTRQCNDFHIVIETAVPFTVIYKLDSSVLYTSMNTKLGRTSAYIVQSSRSSC